MARSAQRRTGALSEFDGGEAMGRKPARGAVGVVADLEPAVAHAELRRPALGERPVLLLDDDV